MRLFSIGTLSLACLLLLPWKQWDVSNEVASNLTQAADGATASSSLVEGAHAGIDAADSAAATDLKPVADLADRVAPWLAKNIVLLPIPKDHGRDVFELQTARGKLIIRASGAPSAAMG